MNETDVIWRLARLETMIERLTYRQEQQAAHHQPVVVVGDPFDAETNPRRRQENARRLVQQINNGVPQPWTPVDHLRWTIFTMQWLPAATFFYAEAK